MPVYILIFMFSFGLNGWQYQKSYDLCLEKSFKGKECKRHKLNTERNERSDSHVQVQKLKR